MVQNPTIRQPMLARGPTQKMNDRVYAVLSVVMLLLIYLKLHLNITGFGIPYFYALLISVGAILVSGNLRVIIGGCGGLLFYLIVQYIFSSNGVLAPKKFDFQFVIYSITNFVVFYGLCLSLVRANTKLMQLLIRVLLYLLLGIAIMEVYGGLKPFVDAARKLYTGAHAYYDAVDRDIRQYGAIRPTAFASEPSSLGNFFGAIWLFYTCSYRNNIRRVIEVGVIMLAAIFVFRTPTLLAYAAVSVLVIVYKFRRYRTLTVFASIALVFAVSILPYIAYTYRFEIDQKNFREFLSTGSFFIRNIAPLNTFLDMVEMKPIFGFGSGFADAAQARNIGEIYGRFSGFYTYDRISTMSAATFMTNAFWEYFIVNGFLGSLILFGLYKAVISGFGVRGFFFLAMLSLVLWTSHAGLILAFTWVPVAVLVVLVSRIDNALHEMANHAGVARGGNS